MAAFDRSTSPASDTSLEPLVPPDKPEVLLVYKRSLYELYVEEHCDERIAELIAEGDVTVASLRDAHERHRRALEAATAVFERAPVRLRTLYRGDLLEPVVHPDLLVVIGGDGTLLDASHHVTDCSVLGLNSDPRTSVGYLCSGVASEAQQFVRWYLDGQLVRRPLARLEVRRDGERIGPLALNDVLIAHDSPAAPTKYILEVGGVRESHVSSGLWVSTAAGSTAALKSAGGTAMALDERRLQFVVRELYVPPGRCFELRSGFVAPGEVLLVRPRIRTGRIYFDGPHIDVPITFGQAIELRTAEQPLWQVCRPPAARS